MQTYACTIHDITSLLARTPAALDTLLRDLPESWTRRNEGGDSWSAFDILGHLIHGERTDWDPARQNHARVGGGAAVRAVRSPGSVSRQPREVVVRLARRIRPASSAEPRRTERLEPAGGRSGALQTSSRPRRGHARAVTRHVDRARPDA